MTLLALSFVSALVVSLAFTPLYRRVALRLGYLQHPTEDRWHERPTPAVGGVAICARALSRWPRVQTGSRSCQLVWVVVGDAAVVEEETSLTRGSKQANRIVSIDEPAASSCRVSATVFSDFRYKRQTVQILWDLGLVGVAYYSAYRLSFDREMFGAMFDGFLGSLPIVLGVQVLALSVVGGHRRTWRGFGARDSVVLVAGVLAGTLGIVGSVAYVYGLQDYSVGIFAIYAVLLIVMIAVSRAGFVLLEHYIDERQQGVKTLTPAAAGARPAYGGSLSLRSNSNLPDLDT